MGNEKIEKVWFIGFLCLLMFSVQSIYAQVYTISHKDTKITIYGTSNLHDWDAAAHRFRGQFEATMKEGKLKDIKKLNFRVHAESLKSGKSGMDDKMYDALKTGEHQMITYELENIENISCSSSNQCKITADGFLTIAGVRNPVELTMHAEISQNKITLSGEKRFNMTNFDIDPPSALFGTIKTGKEVRVEYKAVFQQ